MKKDQFIKNWIVAFSWSSYWSSHLFNESDLLLKSSGRAGLTIPSSIGNDSSILLPYLSMPLTTKYIGIADNGALDIGATDFTICGWVKNEDAAKLDYYMFAGKDSGTNVSGIYGLYILPTNGRLVAYLKSSDGTFSITTNIDTSTLGWFFYRFDVNQTTHKIRLFVNGTQYGSDVNYTGTFSALANAYEFWLSVRNGLNGSGTTKPAKTSHSDTYIFNKLLTTEEETTLINRGYVSGAKAHWPMNNSYGHDVSGNGYHLALRQGISEDDKVYGIEGTRQLLEKGYSLAMKSDSSILYVPNKIDGDELTVTLPAGYYLSKLYDADLVDHNLADSFINIDNANWDRSDVTIFNDTARAGYYDAANPNRWHISELIYLNMVDMYNTGYTSRNYPSYNSEFTALNGIYGYNTNQSNKDRLKVLQYTGNYDSFHILTYSFQDDENHICALSGSKILTFNYTTNVLSLSLNNGGSVSSSVSLNGVVSIICYAQIYSNGNILFCDQNKAYYSEDNLTTYHESTVLDVAGAAYSPVGTGKFTAFSRNGLATINGVEIGVWGPYTQDVNTVFVDVNIWYTIDGGKTIKSLYLFNSSAPLLTAYHVHDVSFISIDNSWMVQTGDTLTHCNWLKLEYNTATDVWTKTSVGISDENGWYKTVGMKAIGTDAIWMSDTSKFGIFKVPYSDIADDTKYTILKGMTATAWGAYFDGNNIITNSPDPVNYPDGDFIVSTDLGKTWKRIKLDSGVAPIFDTTYPVCLSIQGNGSNKYKAEIYEDSEFLTAFTEGYTILFELKKE